MFTNSTISFMVDLQYDIGVTCRDTWNMSIVSCLSCTTFAGWCDDRKIGQSLVQTGGRLPKVGDCLFAGGEDGGEGVGHIA